MSYTTDQSDVTDLENQTYRLVGGSRVQVDRSGVGHCWVDVALDDLPANIRVEIECEIIDGGVESTDCYRTSNGLRYRW